MGEGCVKACSKCGVVKSFIAFPRNRRMRDGHDSWCNPCRSAAKADWRKRPEVAEKLRVSSRRYEAEVRHVRNPERKAEMGKYAECPKRRERNALARRLRTGADITAPYHPKSPLPFVEAPERRRLISRGKYENNLTWRGVQLSKGAARRASLGRATPLWANHEAIAATYAAAAEMSKATGVEFHVDHVVPLKSSIVCGLHCEANLNILPKALNLSKSNRYWPDMPE